MELCLFFFFWLQHLKEHKDPVMQEILTYTEQMLANGRFDMPLSLCFAADRGDDLLLNQLLRRGMDPNELDNNGRRALVMTNQHSPSLSYALLA